MRLEENHAIKTGAVIVAACPSRHTNRFRPILRMGGQSMIRQLVRTFRAAGVERVVVVTGLHSEQVRSELEGEDALLLHNPDFAHTDMLDSIKICLRGCRSACDRVFVTPVCIPPLTFATVRQLMNCGAEVCVPVSNGVAGHPVLLGAQAAEGLLSYQGREGLRGWLWQEKDRVCRVTIEEGGNASKRSFHERVQVRLVGEGPFFGPGPQQLLLGIRSRGSVAGACQAIGISYSKGRRILRQMERELGFSLVDRVQGGANGGSAQLTARGETFLEIFARYEQSVADYAAEIFEDYFGELEELGHCD